MKKYLNQSSLNSYLKFFLPIRIMSERVYVICPVRNMKDKEKEFLDDYVNTLENAGYEVHYPPRDTVQDQDSIGIDICNQNTKAIENADEVHVYWNGKSKGSHFDLGAAYVIDKPIVLINKEKIKKTEGKSFNNVLHKLTEMFYRED